MVQVRPKATDAVVDIQCECDSMNRCNQACTASFFFNEIFVQLSEVEHGHEMSVWHTHFYRSDAPVHLRPKVFRGGGQPATDVENRFVGLKFLLCGNA
jgi:hypothetical protein